MEKKSLLIAVILIFALGSTAIAIENQSAGQNFKSHDGLNASATSDLSSPSVVSSALPQDADETNLPEYENQFFDMNRLFYNGSKK